MDILRATLLFLAFVAGAQCYANDPTSEKKADIDQLLEMSGSLEIGQQLNAALIQMMVQTLRNKHPDIPQRVLDILVDEVSAVTRERMVGLQGELIPLYHKHFTAHDIKGMIAFYSTDLGQKTIRVMPLLMDESMKIGQQWAQTLVPIIDQRVKARLTEAGYGP